MDITCIIAFAGLSHIDQKKKKIVEYVFTTDRQTIDELNLLGKFRQGSVDLILTDLPEHNQYEEKFLLLRIAEGDESDFEQLFFHHLPMARKVVYGIVKQEMTGQ